MSSPKVKPYDELTRLGQLRRIRQLAEAALDAYGLRWWVDIHVSEDSRPGVVYQQHHMLLSQR